jgi:photosystem II stability/assembly factor-like uncharacterized protein
MLPSLRSRAALLLLAVGLLFTRRTALAGSDAWTGGGPPGEVVNALLVDPSDPAALFAATNRGIYRSTDGGAGWTSIFAQPYVNSLAISTTSGTLYAAVAGDGVERSMDGGKSWTLVTRFTPPSPKAPTVLAVDPSEPSTVYAGLYGAGVLKSVDSGKTWVRTAGSGANIVAIAIDQNQPQALYAADLGGPIALPSGVRPASATDASDHGVIYKTTDGGRHWTQIGNGFPGLQLRTIAIDPSNSSILYAGTSGGIFKSIDGGSTWREATTGPGTQVNVFSLDLFDSAIYAGTVDGVYKSQDGGETWSCWNLGLGGRHIAGFARPSGSNLLYVGTGGGGVYKSSDAGASWCAANGDFAGANVTAVAFDPSSPSLAYAGISGGGVFRTEDGGASWVWASTGFTDTVIHSLAVVAADPGTVYAGTDRGVFKSIDGARSWSPTRYTDEQVLAVRTDPASPGTAYAASATGVARTVDAGNSWVFGDTGLPQPRGVYGITALELDPADPATLYAAVFNSGGLFHSTDNGTTWSLVETPVRDTIFSIAIAPTRPETIYLGALGGIFLSRDAGRTWTGPVGPDQRITSLVIDPSISSGVYASTDCYLDLPGCGGVFRTIDGGETWNAISEGLANTRVNALAIDRTGTHLQAGTQGGVFSRTVSPAVIRSRNPKTPPRSLTPR